MKKSLKKKLRVGILGGTFDPPHIGHLHISKIVLKKIKLNYIIWVITEQNPLKNKPYFSKNIRIKLINNILKDQKKIFLLKNLYNIKTKSTFDFLTYFKKKNKKNDLFFIIGADNLIEFNKWKKWKKIPKLARLVIFPRLKYEAKAIKSIALKGFDKQDWIYLNTKKINISSSLIRKF